MYKSSTSNNALNACGMNWIGNSYKDARNKKNNCNVNTNLIFENNEIRAQHSEKSELESWYLTIVARHPEYTNLNPKNLQEYFVFSNFKFQQTKCRQTLSAY